MFGTYVCLLVSGGEAKSDKIIFLFLVFCKISFADNLKIIDGDTIILNGEKIRFSGIDTPELKQTCLKDDQEVPCGMTAKMCEVHQVHRNSV